MTETPWLDTTYDGFDEEQIQKVLKVQRQAQKLLDAAHRVADGEVPLGKLIRLGHKDPMSSLLLCLCWCYVRGFQ